MNPPTYLGVVLLRFAGLDGIFLDIRGTDFESVKGTLVGSVPARQRYKVSLCRITIQEPCHLQKPLLRQIRGCCFLNLVVLTLRPLHPVLRVLRHQLWLHRVHLDTLLSTGFRPDTCN